MWEKRFTWNIPKNTQPTTIQKSYSEAYSATGKIHLRQQAENQKEHVICLAFPYSQKVVMHVNALRRWTTFPSSWIRFKKQCFTWNTTSSTTTRETVLKNYPQQLNHPTLRFTWNTLTSLGRHKAKTMFHVKQPNRHETSATWSTVKKTRSNFHIEAYSGVWNYNPATR